jgi:hypothetical protein
MEQDRDRLFSHISLNWRGRPSVSHEVIVALIGATTQTGLRVEAQLDRRAYPTRVEVSEEQLAQVQLRPHEFHGEWTTPSCREDQKLFVRYGCYFVLIS